MQGSKIKHYNRIIKLILIFCLITISIIAFTLNTKESVLLAESKSSKVNKLLTKNSTEFNSNNNMNSMKISQITPSNTHLNYNIKQSTNFVMKTRQQREITTSLNTNLSIQSEVVNSSFNIVSTGDNSSNEWENDIEPDCGNVNVTRIVSGNDSFVRLNFTESSDPPLFGISNTKFNVSTNPIVTNQSTNISFDFQIPSITTALLSSIHTLALEFRFNNASIHFILSSFGGSFGNMTGNNVTRPSGTNILYIFCNDTPPFNWKQISYNITELITKYFIPQEYEKFSSLETLFCYMITFTPNFQLSLDLDNLRYETILSQNVSVKYTIGTNTIYSEDGILYWNSTLENVTFSAYDNSSWNNNQQTYLKVNITRSLNLESHFIIETWNETQITLTSFLNFPEIIENVSSSIVHMMLPSDWTNVHYINESVGFNYKNQSTWLNDYILGILYYTDVLGMDNGTLSAQTPNYFQNIEVPVDILRNEILKIRGDLRYPISDYVNLFMHNSSFIFHRTTLPMVNSTFLFLDIDIDEQFPVGLLHLTLNWSNSGEFGIYENLVYIHEETSELSSIQIYSQKNITIYKYEPLFINLSLFQGINPYWTNSTLVFLMKETECLFFSRKSQNSFILNISNIIWNSGEYILQIIASDDDHFFATETIVLFIKPASIFWSFLNLQSNVLIGDNISFRIYSFIRPQEGDLYIILSGLDIKIWINDTNVVSYKSSFEGFNDVNFGFNDSNVGDWLYIIITGMVEEKILKLQPLSFYISNETSIPESKRAYLHEIMKSSILANGTYFIYYQIEYSSESTNWYVPISSYDVGFVSAHVLRDNYVIGTQIENQMLRWILNANQTSNDILILELVSPTVYYHVESLSKIFRIEIQTYSDITINNFTVQLDLSILSLPFSNISLLDSINRDITDFYSISIEGSFLRISNFNIISGISIHYYLEGDLQDIILRINQVFQSKYEYNQTMVGSWIINTPDEFVYSVFYSLSGLDLFLCYNTSVTELPNSSSIITAFLLKQKWNKTLSVYIEIVFLSNLIITSEVQNFMIVDTFKPVLDYYIEEKTDFIQIHAYIHEPEGASGIKDVLLRIEDNNYTFTSYNCNHFILNLTEKQFESNLAMIIVTDWAGNVLLSDYFELNRFLRHSQSFFGIFDPQLVFPVFFSSITLGGIGISRMIRKRNRSIL